MLDALSWGAPLVGGAAIALLYFGGLWATIRRVPSSRTPGLLVFSSFAVRTTMAVAGFALLAAGDARRVAVALVGFVAARTVVVGRSWTRSASVEGG